MIKDSILRLTRVTQSAFRRLGFEFQVMPVPKRIAIAGSARPSRGLLESPMNWLRVPMYDAIISCLETTIGQDYFKGRSAIEIGGSEGTIAGVLKSLGTRVVVAPNYPNVDVEHLPYPDCSYDVVVTDQVFEHLRHPWRAAEEIRRVLRPNGLSICTTVFVYPLHKFGVYDDYYRFSPAGLCAIFEGFRIVSSNGWGNATVLKIAYNHSDRGPEGSDPLSKAVAEKMGLYSHTDSMNYIMTWCVAQKPSA